jgi:hypothetical protein
MVTVTLLRRGSNPPICCARGTLVSMVSFSNMNYLLLPRLRLLLSTRTKCDGGRIPFAFSFVITAPRNQWCQFSSSESAVCRSRPLRSAGWNTRSGSKRNQAKTAAEESVPNRLAVDNTGQNENLVWLVGGIVLSGLFGKQLSSSQK